MAQQPSAPPVRRRQADRSALSDRLLTEAAIDLLVESGVHGTTLQAVGERAGYSRALATHRFGSKAGLFGQVLKDASADWLERMQKAVGKLTGADALCAATDATYRFIRERPNEVRAMYLLWFQSIDPGAVYRSNLANVHRAQRQDVAEWILAGQANGEVNQAVNRHRLSAYEMFNPSLQLRWAMKIIGAEMICLPFISHKLGATFRAMRNKGYLFTVFIPE